MKVKITNGNGWYLKREGNLYDVIEEISDGVLRYLLNEDVIADQSPVRFISPKDCQIILNAHTLEDDWQHFLSYSGYWQEDDAMKEKMKQAFVAAWSPSPEALRARLTLTEDVVTAARGYIDVNVCDPDTTAEMWKAWQAYTAAVERLAEGAG